MSRLHARNNRRSVADAATALVGRMNAKLERLHGRWDEVGMNDEMRGERVSAVFAHVDQLLEQMDEEEAAMVETVKRLAVEYAEDVRQIRGELQLDDFRVPADVELLEREEILRAERERLKAIRRQRLEEWRLLAEDDQRLCERLETVAFVLAGPVPSEQQLADLAEHVQQMRELLTARQTDFVEYKAELSLLLARMAAAPPNDFAKSVLRSTEDTFPLSDADMNALASLLETEREKYDTFVRQFRARFDELYAELDRWWEKCLVPTAERARFPSFTEDNISEAVLDGLRKEIARLQAYFGERQSVLEKLDEWRQLWSEKLEHEQRQSDPNRYKNRAGNLDQELKRNKAVEGTLLPRARRELETAVTEWTQTHANDPIVIDGHHPVYYVDLIVREHHEAKEMEKSQKLLAKKQQMEQEIKFGTTPSKTRLSPPKRNLTPSQSSRQNLMMTSKMTLSRARSPMKPPVLLPTGQTRTATGSVKRLMQKPVSPSPSRSPPRKVIAVNDSLASVADYRDFAKGIHGKPPGPDSDEIAHSSFMHSAAKPPLPPRRP